jgi:hypothetical protein
MFIIVGGGLGRFEDRGGRLEGIEIVFFSETARERSSSAASWMNLCPSVLNGRTYLET